MEKYQKISVFITLSVIAITTTTLLSLSDNGALFPKKAPSTNELHTSQIENTREKKYPDDTSTTQNDASSESFLLILDGNSICAYKNTGGKMELLEKATIETSSLSGIELSELSDGIVAKSLEEVYLFFEAYTS